MSTDETTAKAAKASLWFAVCSIVQKCIGLIVIPIYTRLLSEPEYGDYVVFQSWTEIAAILITLNLGSYVFFNGMMKYEDDRDGFAASMLGLTGATGLLWLGAFLVEQAFGSGGTLCFPACAAVHYFPLLLLLVREASLRISIQACGGPYPSVDHRNARHFYSGYLVLCG